MTADSRNFRMLYYEQLGLRNVEQKKALEILLNEDPLDQEKLKIFSQQFMLPAVLRPVVWKVLLNIVPTHKSSMEFIARQRQGQFDDLKQALLTMRMISLEPDFHDENQLHKTIVLMYLLENGILSVLHKNIRKKDGHKVFVLESISKIVCEIIHNECDAYWISKYIFKAQEAFVTLFAKLPNYVKYYLQLEDKRLFEHLCEIQLFKVLPYDKWLQTYFAPVFTESLVYLEKVLDKLVAGSCNVLVFVFVAMLLSFSIKLKELKSSEAALKLISHLDTSTGKTVVDKTMELWEQHRQSLSVELGTSSYLLCYTDVAKHRGEITSIECREACISFDGVCYCKEPFYWQFNQILMWDNTTTCNDIACDKNVVITGAYLPAVLCPDPNESLVFNITSWIENGDFKNFVKFTPGKVIDVLTQLTIDVAYDETDGNSFTFDFDDGYITQQLAPSCNHTYTWPGVYNVTIKVISSKFLSFFVSAEIIVKLPLKNVVLQSCSSSYVVKSSNDTLINCTGLIQSGSSMEVSWDFKEDEIEIYNVSSASMFPTDLAPCMFTCDDSWKQDIPREQAVLFGTFLLPQTKFAFNGAVTAIEFFAKGDGTTAFQIFRLVGNTYISLHTSYIPFQPGYNFFQVPDSPVVEIGDTVGFYLEDMDLFQVINHNDSHRIEYYYAPQQSSILTSPNLVFHNSSFQVRIITTIYSYLYIQYSFKYTGIHDIVFQVADSYGGTIESNKFRVTVTSYMPSISVDGYTPVAVVDKPYNLCVTIKLGAFVEVQWSTTSTTILQIINNAEVPLQSYSRLTDVSEAALEIVECIVVRMLIDGDVSIDISVSVNENIIDSTTKWISVLPAITGLQFNYSIPQDQVHQLQYFTLTGYVDPYPYDLLITWNFGDTYIHNTTADNLTLQHRYLESGQYMVSLSAQYLMVYEMVTAVINVHDIFKITAPEIITVNENIEFSIVINNTLSSTLTYEWYFEGGSAISTNLTNTTIVFTTGGAHIIKCKIITDIGVIERSINKTVYEPVSNLRIELTLGSKPFVGFNFTLKAFSDTGNDLKYNWSFSINLIEVKRFGSEAVVYSNHSGLHQIDIVAYNIVYSATASHSINVIGDYISMFTVVPSSFFVPTGENVTFHTTTVGGHYKSYEFYFSNDNTTIEIENITLSKSFSLAGIYQVLIILKSNGTKEQCIASGIVSCEAILEIVVQDPVQELIMLYIPANNDIVVVNETMTIDIMPRSNLLLKLTAVGGTNVKFQVAIDGSATTKITDFVNEHNTTTEVLLSKTIFWDVKTYTCLVNASNKVNFISRTLFVRANELIVAHSILAEDFIEMNQNFTLQANVTSGTSIQYIWSIDNATVVSNVSVIVWVFSAHGLYNINLTMVNSLSSSTLNKSVTVIIPISGFYFLCPENALKTYKKNSLAFGRISGQRVTTMIKQDDQVEQILSEDMNGPLHSQYIVQFYSPGRYIFNITMTNSYGSTQSHVCAVILQNRIISVTFLMYPKNNVYILNDVLFTVNYYGGTNVTGILNITTQNDLSIALYKLSFISCFYQNCHTATVKHRFHLGDNYHISGSVENRVGRIDITSQNILIIGIITGSKVNEYLEIIAESTILGSFTKIHLIKKNNFDFEFCQLWFGENDEMTMLYSSSPTFVTHQYNATGKYTIMLNCTSLEGLLNLETDAYVQQKIEITNLNKPLKCITFGNSINVSVDVVNTEMLFGLDVFVTLNHSTIQPTFFIDDGNHFVFYVNRNHFNSTGNALISLKFQNRVSVATADINVCITKHIEIFRCQIPTVWRFGTGLTFQLEVLSETVVEISYDFGDGASAALNTTATTVTYAHEYKSVGSFHYTIQGTNKVSTMICNGSVDIIQPISNVTIVHKTLIYWPNKVAEFSLRFFEDLQLNASIQYQIYFGDDENTGFLPLEYATAGYDQVIELRPHSYNYPGCFSITIMVRSGVNYVVLKSNLIIFDVNDISLNLYSEYGDKDQRSTTIFRDDYPLHVSISNITGSCFTYNWIISNHNHTNETYANSTSKSPFIINDLVNTPGFYQITVNVTMPENNFSVPRREFVLKKPIPDLILIPVITSTNENIQFFVITKKDPSVILSMYWNFGDNSSLTMHPDFVSVPHGDADLLSKTNDHRYLSNEIVYIYNASYSYNNTGSYTISVYAENDISRSEVSKNIYISELFCERPSIEILTHSDKKLTFEYSQHIAVFSNVQVNCGSGKKVQFFWKVFKSNKWELENGVSSTGKQEISLTNVNVSQSSLNIEKRSLAAGVYIFQLNILLEGVDLDDNDEVYVIIIEDQLNAIIHGGFFQQLPWEHDFVLDASASNNPTDLDFEWYCEKGEEDHMTDCFGNGNDTVDFFGSKWSIKAKTLMEGVQYKFKIVIQNRVNGQTAETYQVVVLGDVEMPVVSIRCKSNCRESVNPSQRLSLVGECENCDPNAVVKFHWTDLSEDNKINIAEDVLTPQSAPNFVVRPGVLSGGKTYKFGLKVTKQSGVEGHAIYYVKTRTPPSGGTCLISPQNGKSLTTKFTVTCLHWQSSVGSLKYRIFLIEKNSLEPKLLSYGPKSTLTMFLPNGVKEHDYNVDVNVEISDLYEAATTYNLIVKVHPFLQESTINIAQEELLNRTIGDNNELEKFTNEGDTQGLLQFVNSVAKTINLAHALELAIENDTEAEEQKANGVEIRKKMRSAIVEVLTKVPVESIDNMRQTAEAIAPLLKAPEEVTPETQELVLKSFTDMATFLEENKDVREGGNPENVADITRGLVGATGSLLLAISSKDGMNASLNGTSREFSEQIMKKENLTKNTLSVVDKVMPLLLLAKVAGEYPTRIISESIALEMSRKNADEFSGDSINTLNGGSLKLPEKLFDRGIVVLDSKMSTLVQNPFSWHSSSIGIDAPVSSLSFNSENNTVIPVHDLPDDNAIEMIIPQQTVTSKVSLNLTTPEELNVYRVTVTEMGVVLVCHVNVTDTELNVVLLIRRGKRPTIDVYDQLFTFNSTTNITAIFPTWRNISFYYIGVKAYHHNGSIITIKDPDMELEMFTTGCLFLNETTEVWEETGCKVGPATNRAQTHCLCNHLTWFGSNFYIPPNKLDIESEIMKLRNIIDYPALLATFCVICGCYVLALIWARRKDSQDTFKGAPVILKSQSFATGTVYHLSVYTGHRGGSGTTAIPALILSSKTRESQPLILKSEERTLFERGSVETFIFATPEELGDLRHMTIWHDDSGDNPGWFLSRLVVTNLSDNKQYICFCNDWLAVDQSDGQISRVLPVASKEELCGFENIFLAKTAQDLTDGHLWFSIVSRPPRSNFTRVQRVSCCLCLLLTTMLSNAMFYRVADGRAVGDEIDISGFKISWSQILIGFQSSLIVLPVNVLIVLLFRRAKPSSVHKRDKKEVDEASTKRKEKPVYHVDLEDTGGLDSPLAANKPTAHDASLAMLNKLPSYSTRFDDSSFFQNSDVVLSDVQLSCATSSTGVPSPSSKQDVATKDVESVNLSAMSVHLPDQVHHWFAWVKYIAWFLCVVVSFVSGFFTLLYGLSFGRVGQEEWLFSFFVSVFSDIVFNQPIKVVVLAALITLVLRKLKDDYVQTEIESYKNLEWKLDENEEENGGLLESINRPAPPSPSYIKKMRKKRLYEAEMIDVVIEITAYMVYLLLCLLITYGHRDPDAYAMTNNIKNIFIKDKFEKIQSIPDFWSWTHDTLSPGLVDNDWYNGQKIQHDKFLSDTASLILGAVRLRQLRVKEEPCEALDHIPTNLSACGFSYSFDHEDTTAQYCEKWEPCGANESTLYPEYWRYWSSVDTGSYTTTARVSTYSGGGYVVVLGKLKRDIDNTLVYLGKNYWLDDKSRGVLTEFTVYNTQANFYVMVLMLMEIPATGGAFVYTRILTTRLDRYSSGFAIFLGACEILFLIFTFYYMYRELKKISILRWKYLKDWRSWVEMMGFALIWTSFGLLIVRFGLVTMVKNRYFEDTDKFVNFENAALSDQAYGYVLALVAFLVVVKFLKLLRFNEKMLLMFRTILYASTDLKYFTISFALLFLSFAQWSQLLFMRSIESYSTFVSTIETLFNLMLGKFDYNAMVTENAVYGRMFFLLFVFFMTYIILNMFIAIIIDAFAAVQKVTRSRKNKYELIDFLTQRLKAYLPVWLTRKSRKPSEHELTEFRIDMKGESSKKSQTPNPMDPLEKAIDRIGAYVEHMLEEEEFELAMFELIYKIVENRKERTQSTSGQEFTSEAASDTEAEVVTYAAMGDMSDTEINNSMNDRPEPSAQTLPETSPGPHGILPSSVGAIL